MIKQQQGRSMVEMLGVLAIIGVLSVGAISGYSKAMGKYKLNKFSEQLNTLINACIRYSQSFNNLTESQRVTEYFIKMGEVPTEMVKDDTDYIYDVYGRAYYIYYNKLGNLNLYSNSTETMANSTQNFEICQTYFNILKENRTNIEFLELVSGYTGEDDEKASGKFYGDSLCSDDKICLKDLKLTDIYEQCQLLQQGKGWQFNIKFI